MFVYINIWRGWCIAFSLYENKTWFCKTLFNFIHDRIVIRINGTMCNHLLVLCNMNNIAKQGYYYLNLQEDNELKKILKCKAAAFYQL